MAMTLLFPAQSSFACSCGQRMTLVKQVMDHYVFTGKVMQLTFIESGDANLAKNVRELVGAHSYIKATIKPDFSIDEPTPKEVDIYTVESEESCGFQFRLGRQYLIFGTYEGDLLTTDSCSNNQSLLEEVESRQQGISTPKVKAANPAYSSMLSEIKKGVPRLSESAFRTRLSAARKLVDQGKLSAAIAEMNSFVIYSQSDQDRQIALSSAYWQAGDSMNAIQAAKNAIDIGGSSWDKELMLMTYYAGRGNKEHTIAVLKRLTEFANKDRATARTIVRAAKNIEAFKLIHDDSEWIKLLKLAKED